MKKTLTFIDKELEEKYNRQEVYSTLVKLNHVFISLGITGIIFLIFWIQKKHWFMCGVSLSLVLYTIIISYVLVYKKKFQQLIPLIITSMSISITSYQFAVIFEFLNITEQEQNIIEDVLMLLFMIFQIQNNFTLNTCQFLVFMVVKIYIRVRVGFTLISLVLIIYSFIFIKNDYERIRNQRNIFLLQEYNNNQLKMIKNLQSPILVLEYQEQTSRLVEYFINSSFAQKIKNINPIEFIKDCYIDHKNVLYTILGQKLKSLGTIEQLKVKFNQQKYIVNAEIYKGQKILVSLEFQEIKTKNFQAKPYFYNSLLKYLSKTNQQQYFKELMKNLCGFLLYLPGKIFLKVQSIEINEVIRLINPQIVQTNIIQEQIQSCGQLLVLLFYLMKKNNNIQKLLIIMESVDNQRLFKFEIQYALIEIKQKVKLRILKQIIQILGLGDFSSTQNGCQFTLIDIEDKFIEL